MAIVFQKDKRFGITYTYESKAYWDKEKKQSRAKRKLIGYLLHTKNGQSCKRNSRKLQKTTDASGTHNRASEAEGAYLYANNFCVSGFL